MATEPKARAAKATAEAKAAVTDAAAAMPYATFEVPEIFRSFAEQGLNQTRETYARMKSAAEETTDILEDSMETTRESMREVQFKALDMAKANADATFGLVKQLLGTTSVADAVQLQTAFARERFEAFMDYSKDIQATVSKASTEASKPARAMFDKAMSTAKAA